MAIIARGVTPGQDPPLTMSPFQWAIQRWPIVPCNPDPESPQWKSPLVEGGKDAATRDFETIRDWWVRWPKALVGGRCDGRVVLDLDSYKPGHDADLAELPGLPATREHRSARGGRHLIFLDPEGRFRSGTLGSHKTIDVRAGVSRDYVILPTPGSGYEIAEPRDPAVAPDALWEVVHDRPGLAEDVPELPALEDLPPGYEARPETGKDGSEHTYWITYHGVQDGLTNGQLRTLLEDDEITQQRIAEPRRQQARWWPCEFWHCVTRARAEVKKRGRKVDDSAASRLVTLACQLYTFGMASDGEPFALPTSGPKVARLFRGSGHSLRAALSSSYHDQHGKPPGNGPLADAMQVLEGKAQREEPIDLPLRATWHDSKLVIDLGDQTGRAIVAGPGGWEVVDGSPVLFRRTRLTAALPDPKRGRRLTECLFPFLNVAKADRALAAAFLVMSWMSEWPRPVLLLTGPEGVVKTSTTRKLRSLVDPSPVATRGAPEREDWEVTLNSQWVVALDNLSAIPDWLSDAVCRASTGEGWTTRKLYTDNDITAMYALRTVLMNGVDLHEQVSHSDFADRLITFHLEPVTYRAQSEVEREWQEAAPYALGALLDLACGVIHALPTIEASGRNRMADFERVLKATDKVLGTSALSRYEQQAGRAAEDTLKGTPAAMAVLKFGRTLEASWTGYADELGRAAGVRLQARDMQAVAKLTGMMRRAGVSVKRDPQRTKRGYRWTITPM